MCGLAGLVRSGGRAASADDESLVARMCEVQRHRGPDDGGVITLDSAVLGSRRLKIIDLSYGGHMPMGDTEGRWWIVYNGEIYNYAVLRAELERLGCSFRSQSDTEVLLQAYIQWGRDSLRRLEGMFAFAIFDRRSGDVVLVRDRFGKKPLYFAKRGDSVLFASEMKALTAVCSGLHVNEQALAEWFLYRNVDGLRSRTLIAGLQAVLPGQLVTIRGGEVTAETFYSPEQEVSEAEYRSFSSASMREVVDDIDHSLNESVRLRLVSDVPVGTLLSGGLDSSLVTAIAAKFTRELTWFNVSVSDYAEMDESRFAEQLARSLDLPFVSLPLTSETFLRALPQVAYLEDVPLTHANSVPYFLIAQVARARGVIVVQSGEGADEIFGGYSWNYRRRRVVMRLQSMFDLFPARLRSWLALAVYAQEGLPALAHRFREQLPPAIQGLDRFAREAWFERCRHAYAFVPDRIDRAVLGSMLADLGDFLAPLLRRLDRNSMGASVECRAPFLDHNLVRKAMNMPLKYRVGRVDKFVLKEVARRYIPQELIDRKKEGFPLPVNDYVAPLAKRLFFTGGFCEQVLDFGPGGVERILSTGERWQHRLFGYIALELWGRLYFMGQSPGQLGELIEACRR